MAKGKGVNLSNPTYRMSDGSIYMVYINQFIMDERRAEIRHDKRMSGEYWRYHPEFRKWEKRQSYKRNKDKLLAYFAKRYRENADKLRAYGRKHYRDNTAYHIARARARRGELRNAEKQLSIAAGKEMALYYQFRDVLNRLHGKIVFHIDHIIPITRGGQHHPENLQLSTADYNTWKRTRIISDPQSYLGQGTK